MIRHTWNYLFFVFIATTSLLANGPTCTVTGFSIPTNVPKTTRWNNGPLDALVYNEYGYSSSSFDDDHNNGSSSTSLVSFLTDAWSSSSLARLACAFAPPGHELHPSDLTSAQVVAVDDHHIEISAVLCDTEACVTVAVPVEFPQECPLDFGNTQQDCILNNLQRLDDQAVQVIQQQEWNQHHVEAIQQHNELMQELQKDEFDDMPSWWINPSSSMVMMQEECQHVKDLLNESEFQQDILTLATRTCTELYPLDTFQVLQTAVAMVGPAGMIIRAQVRLDDDDSALLIVNLPIRFSQPVETVEELRACVLGVVAV